ncbi:MAG TPA: site-specific recombinase [Microvirga sp.]|nr:site-specific recombinase [Microvirga sp.]
MSIIRVTGIKRYRHPSTGIWYTYHRATGTRIEPPNEFGSASFFAALQAADAKAARRAPILGTWGALVRSYRDSPTFQLLRPRTKRDYLTVLDWLKGIDEMPAAQIDGPFVARLRDKAFRQRKTRFANYVPAMMSVVFAHAIETGLAKRNPARGIRKIRKSIDAPIANRAWTENEKQAVLEHAPAHLIVPIAIARWTGLRQGDVVHMNKAAYNGGNLNLTTAKRGVPLWFRCPKPLEEILDSIPEHNGTTLCVTSRGTPWTQDGFRASFFKLIRKLEAADLVARGLTFHGLRTSFAEEARGNGFTHEEIADALAQNDPKSAAHYTRNVDRRRSVKAISESLDGTNSAQNLSTRVSTLGQRRQTR